MTVHDIQDEEEKRAQELIQNAKMQLYKLAKTGVTEFTQRIPDSSMVFLFKTLPQLVAMFGAQLLCRESTKGTYTWRL